MGSELKASRNGYKLVIDVPKRPLPPTKNVFPVPHPGTIGNSYLTLSLLDTVGTLGRQSILVESSESLPGGLSNSWSLWHLAYQGTQPLTAHYQEIPILIKSVGSDIIFSVELLDPVPEATHSFYLVSQRNGIRTEYVKTIIQTPQDTTILTVAAIASDSVLSAGAEKRNLISRYNTAVSDKDTLIEKAKQFGVGYSDLSNAFGSLDGYLKGLTPAWSNLLLDTQIDSTVFLGYWDKWDTERAKLSAALRGLTAWVTVAVTSNQSIASPVLIYDGYTVPNGSKLLLAGQYPTTDNGIYSAAVTIGGTSAETVYPTSGAWNSVGTYADDAKAYDHSLSTFATLDSPLAGTASVAYSGFSGAGTAGALKIKVGINVDAGDTGVHSTGSAWYSTDGVEWTQFSGGAFTASNQGVLTLSASLSGIPQSNLRVRVDAVGFIHKYKIANPDPEPLPGDPGWVLITEQGLTAIQVYEVWFEASSISAGTCTLTKVAEVVDGESYLVQSGTTYGGKSVQVVRPITNGPITLISSVPPFQAPLPGYTGSAGMFLQNAAGVISWATGSAGLPGYTGSAGLLLQNAGGTLSWVTGSTGSSLPGYTGATQKVLSNTSGAITWELPSGSGSATWGGITGTLSSQTDLNSALAGKQTTLNGTGFIKASGTTISYDSNTYYLNSNPNGYSTNAGTVTSIATTSPITGGTITSSGTIGINVANTSQSGYLTSTDWNTFNGKQAALGYAPVSRAGDSSITGKLLSTATGVSHFQGNDSGNNLALDATSAGSTFLNFYSGTGGVKFGAGNSTAAVATMSNTGILQFANPATGSSATTASIFRHADAGLVLQCGSGTSDDFAIVDSAYVNRLMRIIHGGTTVIFYGAVTGTSFNSMTGLGSAAPLMDSTATVGTSTLLSRQDHIHPSDTTRLNNSYLLNKTLSTDANSANSVYGTETNYLGAGAANKPAGTDHALLTMAYSNAWAVQMAGDWRTNNWYVRNQQTGTWGSWATVLTTANINTQAASIQAISAMRGAPIIGLYAEMLANTWVIPIVDVTYYYATDYTASDGKLGTLFKYTSGGWVQQTPSVVAGRVTAAVITAGAIGATALATRVALVSQVISSETYQSGGAGYSTWSVAGNNTGIPSGWGIYSAPIASKYADGTTGSVIAEFGGDVSIGGYKAAIIANRVRGNTYTATSGYTDFLVPDGVVLIEVTLQAAGGSGFAGSGTGGSGGLYIRRRVTVQPHNTYRLTAGGVGFNSYFSWVSFDGTTGFTTDSGFPTITATCGANGVSGSYTASAGAVNPYPFETPEDGWYVLGGSGGDNNYSGSYAGAGGAVGQKAGGSGGLGFSSDGCGGGGASAMGAGGAGARNQSGGTGLGGAGGIGAGGGSGYSAGAGGSAFTRARW